MHTSLHCHVLLICSIIFTISRSVDCRRGTDTREGRREGTRGEGREEICPSHEFSNFFTMKPLTRNHPFVAQNALKLCSKVKTKKFSGVLLLPDFRFRGGEKGRMGERMKWKGMGPHFFIQVYAYGVVIRNLIKTNIRCFRRVTHAINCFYKLLSFLK